MKKKFKATANPKRDGIEGHDEMKDKAKKKSKGNTPFHKALKK